MLKHKKIDLTILIEPVFKFLQKIPDGKVVTYAIVAKKCGIPNPRNVSWILRQNILPEEIPCYKVISASGYLASGYKFGGPVEQERRLTASGIEFDERGKVLPGQIFSGFY